MSNRSEANSIPCHPTTLCVEEELMAFLSSVSCVVVRNRKWTMQKKLHHQIQTSWIHWLKIILLFEVFFFSHNTIKSFLALSSILPSPPPPLVSLSFLIHDEGPLFLSVCFWLCCPLSVNTWSLFPPQPLLPPGFHSPAVSLSSVSWRCRSVHVGAHVVLSYSGFTHSRYYQKATVSLADSHLDKAVNHLAGNEGRWPLCQAYCPQMKGHAYHKIINVSCWTVMRLFCQMFPCPSYFLFLCRENRWVPLVSENKCLNLCSISSIISVVSHFFSNYSIIQAMNNDLMNIKNVLCNRLEFYEVWNNAASESLSWGVMCKWVWHFWCLSRKKISNLWVVSSLKNCARNWKYSCEHLPKLHWAIFKVTAVDFAR